MFQLQDPKNLTALVTKAECLYCLCKFEHALVFYNRAIQLSPNSKKLAKEKDKCEKTILNTLSGKNVFNFKGSHNFIDFVTDSSSMMKLDEEENILKLFAGAVCLKSQNEKANTITKKGKQKERLQNANPLKSDQEYFRNLGKNLKPIIGLEQEW